jgi:hypothetical protein
MRFNEGLAIMLFTIIPALWVMQGMGYIKLPAEVMGALIVTWTLIIQYFFRKAPTEKH